MHKESGLLSSRPRLGCSAGGNGLACVLVCWGRPPGLACVLICRNRRPGRYRRPRRYGRRRPYRGPRTEAIVL